MPRGVYREIAAPVLEPLHSRYGQEQWEDGDLFDGNLEQPPCFKRKLQSLKLKHFGPAIFECQLTPIGDPSIVVEWLHDGRPIQAANRVRMICEFGYCSLIYDVAYPRDSGVISCIASNVYGSDRTSTTLLVKEEKSLVEETQLPEGQRGVQRLRELERSTAAALAAVAAVTEDVSWFLNGSCCMTSPYQLSTWLPIDCVSWVVVNKLLFCILTDTLHCPILEYAIQAQDWLTVTATT
uniref:Ig-like domain-containing protein n=1 Tax=Eptatretus burgeri TaxID=7764 RepID=A0A8C4R8C1_EPTBU